MAGDTGLTNIENNIDKLLIRDHKIVSDFVLSSLEYKSKFIEIDEFDRGERIKLNFAHTFVMLLKWLQITAFRMALL